MTRSLVRAEDTPLRSVPAGRSAARSITEQRHTITFTLEIEPTALTLVQQQADQQGFTLDQLAARSIGRAAAQEETQAGHIRAANTGVRLVERYQPPPRRPQP